MLIPSPAVVLSDNVSVVKTPLKLPSANLAEFEPMFTEPPEGNIDPDDVTPTLVILPV